MPTNEVTFHEEAAAEYDAAFDWYLERSPDSTLRFDAEVSRAFTEIAQAPHRWVRGPYGTRRFMLRGFPFLVIYREMSAGSVQILAVAHASRRPGYWKTRM